MRVPVDSEERNQETSQEQSVVAMLEQLRVIARVIATLSQSH
jgi:hypothetical protein